MASPADALSYHEPQILTVLIQSSFLLLLNIVGYLLDRVVYCGLVGQLIVGIAFGTPGTAWLSRSFQETITQLGYLGLILIVFEGGLSTSIQSLRSNLWLSVAVAITGISLPIALSFSLLGLADGSRLQAFAAGSALCSTSLGTTFAVLKSTGLASSRLGTVLTSAAMLDDLIGLVMVQIISNMGSTSSSIDAVTIVRPIGVSVAFAVVVPAFCVFVIGPILRKSLKSKSRLSAGDRNKFFAQNSMGIAFVVHTIVLVGVVTGSTYAGTSNLFAAYLAGAAISWVDGQVQNSDSDKRIDVNEKDKASADSEPREISEPGRKTETMDMSRISTPSTETSNEPVSNKIRSGDADSPETSTGSYLREQQADAIEKYSHLPESLHSLGNGHADIANVALGRETESLCWCTGTELYEAIYAVPTQRILTPMFFASIGFAIPIKQMFKAAVIWRAFVYTILMALGKLACGLWLARLSDQRPPMRHSENEKSNKCRQIAFSKPKSIYPASLLGFAMVARGEIGFLVSAIAQSNGIFASNKDSNASSDIFLIVTWAIVLCTIIGPIAVGLLVNRVKDLQMARKSTAGSLVEDPMVVFYTFYGTFKPFSKIVVENIVIANYQVL